MYVCNYSIADMKMEKRNKRIKINNLPQSNLQRTASLIRLHTQKGDLTQDKNKGDLIAVKVNPNSATTGHISHQNKQ